MGGSSEENQAEEGFNGAAFFQSGKYQAGRAPDCDSVRASMEPLFFKAENQSMGGGPKTQETMASMEPLFFKAENFYGRPVTGSGTPASMEPLFFKAENTRQIRASHSTSARFNGAAFFQSGKCWQRSAIIQPLAYCFNGAAFFQSGKYYSPSLWITRWNAASMEPLFFKAENYAGTRQFSYGGDCFNGAAFFQSGKLQACRRG